MERNKENIFPGDIPCKRNLNNNKKNIEPIRIEITRKAATGYIGPLYGPINFQAELLLTKTNA